MRSLSYSVLTPTFNRASVLHRTYNSLKQQSVRNFEWVVVDDGSTDNTPCLLRRWQHEANFPVTWFRYSNNRGRNAAVNTGKTLVKGEYTLILDSDDALLPDALQLVTQWRVKSQIDSIPSTYQLAFRCVDKFGELFEKGNSGKPLKLSDEMSRVSTRELTYGSGKKFELIGVMKTDVIRQIDFVELTNCEHCPPSVTFNKTSNVFETIVVDHPIRQYYRDDGVARLSDKVSGRIKNPRGNYLRAISILNDDICLFWVRPRIFTRAAYKTARLGLHIGRPLSSQFRDLTTRAARLLWAIAIPSGVVGYLRDRIRGARAPRADLDVLLWGPAVAPENAELHAPPERFSN